MSIIFQIKRGLKAKLPILKQGEFAMTTDSGAEELHLGTGAKNLGVPLSRDGVIPSYGIRTYTSLAGIGITTGQETIEAIARAMPDNSRLVYEVGDNNANIYPTKPAVVDFVKLTGGVFKGEFIKKTTDKMYGDTQYNYTVGHFAADGAFYWSGWEYVYDAVNKPSPGAIGAAVTVTYAATITTSWVASGSYFYQDITVTGIKYTDEPIMDINPGSDNALNVQYNDAFGAIFRITTTNNDTVRVWATYKPSVAIPIKLKVVR